MACLALLLAFLALVLVASTKTVSARRTTVTTVVVDDDDENTGRPHGGCGVRVHELLHCRHYLSRGRQQQLQECCQQLRQLEEPFRCEGIRKVVREKSQREHLQGRELRELIQKAQDLPSPSAAAMPDRHQQGWWHPSILIHRTGSAYSE